MALTPQDLDQLATTGFGPVTFTKKRGHWLAVVADREATVTPDGVAIAVSATAPAAWPAVDGMPEEVVEQRVRLLFDDLGLARRELTEVVGSEDGTQVGATLWLDSEVATRGELAAAVRAVGSLAESAAFGLASIASDLRAEVLMIHQVQERLDAIPTAADIPAAPSTPAAPAPAAAPAAPAAPAASAAAAAAAAPAAPAPPFVAGAAPPDPSMKLPEPATPVATTVWVYVDAPTAMMGADDTSRQVGQAVPGEWYQLESEAGGWALVASTGGLRGWIDAAAVRRQA